MKELLRFRNVACFLEKGSYLRNYNLTIFAGEIVCVLGKSDSGIKAIEAILAESTPIDSGSLFYQNEKCKDNVISQIKVCRMDAGDVMIPHFSVAENITAIRGGRKNIFSRYDKNKSRRLTKRILDEMGIDMDPDTIADELSLKEQMLLCLAKAKIQSADLIVLNSGNIDLREEEREEIWQYLKNMSGMGISVLIISEKPDAYALKADKIQLLWQGRDIWQCTDGVNNTGIYQYLETDGNFEKRNYESVFMSVVWIKNVNWDERMSWKEFLIFVSEEYKEKWDAYIGISIKDCLDPSRESIIENRIVFIPYNSANLLIDNLSFEDNLAICIAERVGRSVLKIQHSGSKRLLLEDYKRIIENNRLNLDMDDLSYVEKKILSIYRWLLAHPQIIFLENPLWGMDMGEAKEFYYYLSKIENMTGQIIIYDRNSFMNADSFNYKKVIDK